jgi:hypothetical protein
LPLFSDRPSFDQASGGFAESGPVIFEERKAAVKIKTLLQRESVGKKRHGENG